MAQQKHDSEQSSQACKAGCSDAISDHLTSVAQPVTWHAINRASLTRRILWLITRLSNHYCNINAFKIDTSRTTPLRKQIHCHDARNLCGSTILYNTCLMAMKSCISAYLAYLKIIGEASNFLQPFYSCRWRRHSEGHPPGLPAVGSSSVISVGRRVP